MERMEKIDYYEQRKLTADYMKRLYDRKLTTASGGNISLRINDKLFCITPSGLDKGNLQPEVIAVVALDGTPLTQHIKLSIETEMHRKILLARPDVQAVVHAHPVYASAFSSCMPCPIDTALTAETYCVLGTVVNVPYQLMGTTELAEVVCTYAKKHNALLMENHGALTLGKNMLEAFDRMELLERAALMSLIAQHLPNSHRLNPAQLAELDRI